MLISRHEHVIAFFRIYF